MRQTDQTLLEQMRITEFEVEHRKALFSFMPEHAQSLSSCRKAIGEALPSEVERDAALAALDKLLMFDVTLVFETYIRSLVAEIETAKRKSERYARNMEEKVKERTQQLEEISRTDSLTGLLNIRHQEEIVTRILRGAQRRVEAVSIVYIDIDDFKKINDSEGHQRGDEVLRILGRAIKGALRTDDIGFRCGGDEFCVVLNNCVEARARELFVEPLVATIKERLGEVSVSIGIAQTGPHDHLDAATVIREADERMYAEKAAFKLRNHPLQSAQDTARE